MNYEDMTTEELEAENIRLSNERSEIRAEQVRLRAALDARLLQAQAQRKIETMSDAERAALAQAIGVYKADAESEAIDG